MVEKMALKKKFDWLHIDYYCVVVYVLYILEYQHKKYVFDVLKEEWKLSSDPQK